MKRLLLVGLCVLPLLLSACFDNNDEPGFSVDDLPDTANAEHGEKLFKDGKSGVPPCSSCHTGEDSSTAPSLKGIANRAGERVEGESAQEYLLNSIIAPGKHLVKGYSNQMFGNYADKLSKQDIADLIAYLQTLE